ncbi:hypothetical protein RJ639_010588 [Escallonia herrerae]|uniref:Polyprotein n=1 Tax=Escallonia herrerae TaxID=1293975 RepID=A0AA88VNK5_9ASTE|nr:hypothetical protein RJ639_010588 [Escallonia herrerae]
MAAPNTSRKYDLEKFDGSNYFSLWRMKMRVVLIQQGMLKALKEKQGLPDTISDDEKEDMLERAHSAMLLKDCPERKGKKKDTSKTADAGVVEDNSNGADVLLVTISSSDGEWILDTGCSYLMCPNRDWFVTYHSFDGGKVLMGNNVAYGVMRIMKGALVVMKGLKQNSLYLLQGSTVTRAVAAAASSSDIDSDTTELWHMRLGHMSERGVDVLSKQGLLGSKKIGKLDFCEHCVFGKQFLISRDVTFDESSMLSKKKELIDAGKDHDVREKVELEVRALDSLPIIPTDEDDGSHSTEQNEEPYEQQYNIARNRPRREIRPPQKLADGSHIYLLLYVDDMLIAAKSMSDVNGLKEQLKREFEMKDLGAAKRIFGMEIQRDRPAGILYLSQKKYIERVLLRFDENLADMMIKHIPEVKFKHCLDLISISSV